MPVTVLNSDPIDTDITVEEHIQYWRNALESTQSSISGMHFGFYKATATSPSLAQMITNIVRTPIKGGFASVRHSNSLNVSLQKEERDFLPTKQRTIHLLEASFSQGAKCIFIRRMLSNARKHDLLPEEV